ncbi:aKG-HExxH-type peptide beta-hydroxylase [Nocardia alni]|uniref:aKG-HExxH-type peptide beta-hydroxylase n=1 Tax=Nocardia alni TaxID=2815723 RepID=UPI001C237747|nr:HEXXH motif-containing putative peptide modification protein [Nocardia alni]
MVKDFYTTPAICLSHLAEVYARHSSSVASELASISELSASVSALREMPPEAYWAALTLIPRGHLTVSDIQPVARALNRAATKKFGAIDVIGKENATEEDQAALKIISGNVYGGASASKSTLAAGIDNYRYKIASALERIKQCWPEAAVEMSLLIDRVLVLDRTELSASHDQMFGIVFAGTHWFDTTARTMEVLLHECGHHSMFLRTARITYLTNPNLVVSHPLRPDPRPLFGTLHAAFVLWRMHQGLARWVEYSSAPEGSDEYRMMVNDRTKLQACLEILDKTAEWTDIGRALFDSIMQGIRTEYVR